MDVSGISNFRDNINVIGKSILQNTLTAKADASFNKNVDISKSSLDLCVTVICPW